MLKDLEFRKQATGVSYRLVEYLRSKIITGELAHGERLNESTLSKFLGVSRSPLREAFKALENESLVVNFERKGTFVTELSVEDLESIYQVRDMMECCAVDLLAEKKLNKLPNVEKVLEEETRCPVPFKNDMEGRLYYQQVLAEFHITLVESSGNSRLLQLYKAISSSLNRYQFIYLSTTEADLEKTSLEIHKEIYKKIKEKNHDQAKKILKEHIRHTYRSLLQEILKDN